MPINLTDILLGLMIVIGAALLVLTYEIVKQQGRVLLRLDALDAHLGFGEDSGSAGIPVGEPFGTFEVPDYDGNIFNLGAQRGRRTLIVNWSPHCGFCERIAPELAELDTAFRAHNVDLVFATADEEDMPANRALAARFGFSGRFVYQDERRKIPAFEGKGTPVAYLIDESGRVAQPIALGADQVPVLARLAVGKATVEDYNTSRVRREGTCGRRAAAAAVDTRGNHIEGAGPGTELKRLLARFGLAVTADCPCAAHAAAMDRHGADWCAENIDTIVGWMRDEARRRGIVFSETAARLMARRAIAKARRQTFANNLRESVPAS